MEELLLQVSLHAEFVAVSSNINLCRDYKDNFLLSLGADSNATYLLTGDKDLLEVNKLGKTKIVTITQFLSERSTNL